jgi:serine phosphatase RsbU (regulator of sigma subunit)
MIALAVVDVSLPRNANISGALVLAPFLASAGARPRSVLAIGTVAVTVAVALAYSDGSGLHASLARITVILVGTIVAGQAARLRLRREQGLIDLTSIAVAAQRAIIRQPPAKVGNVVIATRYQSSVKAATVGGDCYEALDTSFGTRLIIGDVRGHGLPSVRLAALVLGAFRALAYIEADLAAVAHELDLLTSRYAHDPNNIDIDGEEFVTAVLCQVNDFTVTVANCGHPPPLLISSDGEVRRLDAAVPALPLGLGGHPGLESVHLDRGGRVLLYTDGLIEARDQHGQYFDLDTAAVILSSGPLDSRLAEIMAQLNAHGGGQIGDDVALLAFEPAATIPHPT